MPAVPNGNLKMIAFTAEPGTRDTHRLPALAELPERATDGRRCG